MRLRLMGQAGLTARDLTAVLPAHKEGQTSATKKGGGLIETSPALLRAARTVWSVWFSMGLSGGGGCADNKAGLIGPCFAFRF